MEELEKTLKPELTDKFLSTLVKAGRTCGWGVDVVEVAWFIKWCFDVAGKEPPQDYNVAYDESGGW